MTDKKRSRRPVFFRPDFKRRVVQGADYLQVLWQRGARFWEERWATKKVNPKKRVDEKKKEASPEPTPRAAAQEEDRNG